MLLSKGCLAKRVRCLEDVQNVFWSGFDEVREMFTTPCGVMEMIKMTSISLSARHIYSHKHGHNVGATLGTIAPSCDIA